MRLETFPALEDPAPRQVLVDCRVYERKSCEVPTKCHPASLLAMKEAGWSATIRDISEGGVLVHVSRRFEKGTPLAIELPGNQSDEPSVVFVKVVHIKRWDDGGWALGCKFFHELGEDELQRLLTPEDAAIPAASESRQPEEVAEPAPSLLASVEAEAPAIVEEKILSNVRFQIAIQPGWHINGQFKRFNATTCWPLVPGKIIRLQFSGGKQASASFKVQIVECRQEADGWRLDTRPAQPTVLADVLAALGSRE